MIAVYMFIVHTSANLDKISRFGISFCYKCLIIFVFSNNEVL